MAAQAFVGLWRGAGPAAESLSGPGRPWARAECVRRGREACGGHEERAARPRCSREALSWGERPEAGGQGHRAAGRPWAAAGAVRLQREALPPRGSVFGGRRRASFH